MRKPTQKEQVRSMLTAAGSWGLRSDVFLAHGIPRAAARVNELNEELPEQGYKITSDPEEQFCRYRLVPLAGVGAGTEPKGHSPTTGEQTLEPRACLDSGEARGDVQGTEVPAGVSQPATPAPARLFDLPAPRPLNPLRDQAAA